MNTMAIDARPSMHRKRAKARSANPFPWILLQVILGGAVGLGLGVYILEHHFGVHLLSNNKTPSPMQSIQQQLKQRENQGTTCLD